MNGRIEPLPAEEYPRNGSRAARILVVETDDQKRTWLRNQLERAGWDVHASENAREAFVVWVRSREPFDLLLIDPQASGDSALSLWGRLAFLQRGLRVLLLILPPEVTRDDPEERAAVGDLVKGVEAALRSQPSTSV